MFEDFDIFDEYDFDMDHLVEQMRKGKEARDDAKFAIDERRRKYAECLAAICSSEEGLTFVAFLMQDMGRFRDVYAGNASVYQKAALSDFSRRLEQDIDNIDLNIMQKIKKRIYDYMVELRQKSADMRKQKEKTNE